MTKKETIQVLPSIEDRAVDFPYMTACDWVAIAAAKRHLQEEPVSEDLEEAAKKAGQKYFPNENNIWARPNYEARKAECAFMEGAQWQKENLMDKACSFLRSYQEYQNHDIATDSLIEAFKMYIEL